MPMHLTCAGLTDTWSCDPAMACYHYYVCDHFAGIFFPFDLSDVSIDTRLSWGEAPGGRSITRMYGVSKRPPKILPRKLSIVHARLWDSLLVLGTATRNSQLRRLINASTYSFWLTYSFCLTLLKLHKTAKYLADVVKLEAASAQQHFVVEPVLQDNFLQWVFSFGPRKWTRFLVFYTNMAAVV